MNLFRAKLLWLGCIVLSLMLPISALATSPEATVKEIVDRIKAAANPAPIVDYVDWVAAFKGVPAEQKTMMKIETPEKMKEFYKNMLTDPGAMMKARMEEQMGKVPADQQAMMKQSLAQVNSMVMERQAQMKQQIKETVYTVGTAVVDGDIATVPLSQVYQGQKKENSIKLHKVGDRWLLESAGMFVVSAPAVSAPAVPPQGMKMGGNPTAMPPAPGQ